MFLTFILWNFNIYIKPSLIFKSSLEEIKRRMNFGLCFVKARLSKKQNCY